MLGAWYDIELLHACLRKYCKTEHKDKRGVFLLCAQQVQVLITHIYDSIGCDAHGCCPIWARAGTAQWINYTHRQRLVACGINLLSHASPPTPPSALQPVGAHIHVSTYRKIELIDPSFTGPINLNLVGQL